MKLIVMGHGRHGKDTVAEMIHNLYGYPFVSSSWWYGKHVVWPELQAMDGEQGAPRYQSFEDAYADRANHRRMWFDIIKAHNDSLHNIAAVQLFHDYDIYVGMRNRWELHALHNAGAFDAAIWVDASRRLPLEPDTSITVEPWMADYILDNNGTLDELRVNVIHLMANLERKFHEK